VEGSCEHGNETSGSLNVGTFVSSFSTGDFSRRTQLQEVSSLSIFYPLPQTLWRRMLGRLISKEFERIWKEVVIVYSRYYSSIYLEGLK
jgi:hypothetical protein